MSLWFLLQALCVIVPEKGDVAAFKDYTATAAPSPPKPAAAAAATPKPQAPPAPSAPTPLTPASSGGRVAASPLARKLAAEKGIDISVRAVIMCVYV